MDLLKKWNTNLELNWDQIPSRNVWTFCTAFPINNLTCEIILLIQEGDSTRDLSDASVVIVIGKDFASLSSIDLK